MKAPLKKPIKLIAVYVVEKENPSSGRCNSAARAPRGWRAPGGNITGLSSIAPDLEGKRLELLREVSPKLSHVAYFNPLNPFHAA
jgi:ABC-type uncharacterized transport system substrate-binding protein